MQADFHHLYHFRLPRLAPNKAGVGFALSTALFLILCFAISYSPAILAFPLSSPVPGGVILLKLDDRHEPQSARYNSKRLAVIEQNKQNYLLVGIPLTAKPGMHYVSIENKQGKKLKLGFKVNSKTYKAQYLTIKNKRKVNPYEKDMPRILSEKKRKTRARQQWSDQTVRGDFMVPVDGRISSIFGLRRFFNKQPRRPHSGLDIAAVEGTPIRAVESGQVIESGDFFFSGNMVYIDHGQGLKTLYAHMHTIDVQPGQWIEKGQVIGTVGKTGRVTGPHLHLAVILNQTLVDPLAFLPQLNDKAQAYYSLGTGKPEARPSMK